MCEINDLTIIHRYYKNSTNNHHHINLGRDDLCDNFKDIISYLFRNSENCHVIVGDLVNKYSSKMNRYEIYGHILNAIRLGCITSREEYLPGGEKIVKYILDESLILDKNGNPSIYEIIPEEDIGIEKSIRKENIHVFYDAHVSYLLSEDNTQVIMNFMHLGPYNHNISISVSRESFYLMSIEIIKIAKKSIKPLLSEKEKEYIESVKPPKDYDYSIYKLMLKS